MAAIGKTGAKKSGRGKTASAAKPLGATRKVKCGEKTKTYKKVACSKLKSEATKKAKKIREADGTARIKKDPVRGTWCVFKGAKKKTAKKKRA